MSKPKKLLSLHSATLPRFVQLEFKVRKTYHLCICNYYAHLSLGLTPPSYKYPELISSLPIPLPLPYASGKSLSRSCLLADFLHKSNLLHSRALHSEIQANANSSFCCSRRAKMSTTTTTFVLFAVLLGLASAQFKNGRVLEPPVPALCAQRAIHERTPDGM